MVSSLLASFENPPQGGYQPNKRPRHNPGFLSRSAARLAASAVASVTWRAPWLAWNWLLEPLRAEGDPDEQTGRLGSKVFRTLRVASIFFCSGWRCQTGKLEQP